MLAPASAIIRFGAASACDIVIPAATHLLPRLVTDARPFEPEMTCARYRM
jgi:hypothetical protein